MHLDVSVVPRITGKINRVLLKAQHLEFLKNKFGQNMLADSLPQHPESSTIDMLIGNDCYFDLLEPQKLTVCFSLTQSLDGFWEDKLRVLRQSRVLSQIF